MTDITYEPTREHWTPYEPWMRDVLADDTRVSWSRKNPANGDVRSTWAHVAAESNVGRNPSGYDLRIHPDDCPERPIARDALTPERLDEIRERAEAATEGPWRSHDFGHAGEEEPSSIVVHVGRFDHSDLLTYDTETAVAYMPRWERQESDNATFIAHARTDVPDLLAEVDRLTAELATARAAWDEWKESSRAGHAHASDMADEVARLRKAISRLFANFERWHANLPHDSLIRSDLAALLNPTEGDDR